MKNDKVIDISEWNGAFDAASAIKQGAVAVIIRCGYGSDTTTQDDAQYLANISRCEAAGLPWGVYLYSYATTTAMARSEAAHAIRLVKGKNPTWGVWYDVEDSKQASVDNALLSSICSTFCLAVQNAGYYTGIYATASWLKNRLSTAAAAWPTWVAHWTTASSPGWSNDKTVLWQYEQPPGDNATPISYDWNRVLQDFVNVEVNPMSRVLRTKQNQITQGYGNGHTGVDLVGYQNALDDITAHSAGTVTYVQTGYGNNPGSSGNASYGNLVKIRHGNGQYTLYAHLASVAVKQGDTVAKGQKIGAMGNSGNSYGAHLHFEVRNSSDSTINPTPYINADLQGLQTTTKPPKEEIDMTKAEVEAMIDERAQAKIDKFFDTLRRQKCPEWAIPYMQEMIDDGIYTGDNADEPTVDNTRPESYVKRDELAAALVRLQRKPVIGSPIETDHKA